MPSSPVWPSVARRSFLAGTGACLVTQPGLCGSAVREVGAAESDLKLWYERPASKWVEALPLGNGRLGAMVFGRVKQERLQLNEDRLWAGSPYDPNNPEALAALPAVRQLIDQGEYKQAQDLVSKSMMARPLSEMPYGTAGDVFLDFLGGEFAGSYKRSLDIATALAKTTFRVKGGRVEREVFVSEPDQVIVVRLVARDAARLDFDIGYRHPRPVDYGAAAYQGSATPVDAPPASFDIQEQIERENRPAELLIQADGPQALLVTGRNASSAGIPAGLKYAVRICARGDGRIVPEGDGLKVRAARAVTLVIAAATSFINFAR